MCIACLPCCSLYTLIYNNVVMHGIFEYRPSCQVMRETGQERARLYSCTPLHIKSDCLTPVIDPCPVIDLHVFGSELTQRPPTDP